MDYEKLHALEVSLTFRTRTFLSTDSQPFLKQAAKSMFPQRELLFLGLDGAWRARHEMYVLDEHDQLEQVRNILSKSSPSEFGVDRLLKQKSFGLQMTVRSMFYKENGGDNRMLRLTRTNKRAKRALFASNHEEIYS